MKAKKRIKDLEQRFEQLSQKLQPLLEAQPKTQPAEPTTLEAGKWYKHNYRGFLNFIRKDDGKFFFYGFSGELEWTSDISFTDMILNHLTPATNEEVFEALKAEAEKRGFKAGVKVDRSKFSVVINNSVVLGEAGDKGFQHSPNCKTIELCNNTIFENGQWAEIIPQPEIDWSKPGQLVSNSDDSIIVLITGAETDNTFNGVVLKDNQAVGYYQSFYKQAYAPYTGTITLSNK